MSLSHKPRVAACFASLLAMALGLYTATGSAAELARVEGFGPVSRGLAGGGVAHPVGAAAMLLNPAELLSLETNQELMGQFTVINARIAVEQAQTREFVRSGTLGLNRGPYTLPELAYAVRRGDWAFGTGLFAAGGFGIEYEEDSFLSRTTTNSVETGLTTSSRVSLLRIPFALAWQAHPRLRVGASLDVVNSSTNLASLLDVQQVGLLIQSGRASGSLVPVLAGIPNLSGAHVQFLRDNPLASQLEAWGLGGRAGISFALRADTQMALAYEFQTDLRDLQGRGRLTAVDADNNHIALFGRGSLPQFQFPQGVVVGVSHRHSPALALTADLRRMFWHDTLNDTTVSFQADGGGDLRVVLPTGFNNLTTLTLGVEWKARPNLVLRGGGSHAFQHTVPGERLSGSFPTLTRNHLTAALSWLQSRAHQFDVSLSYGFTDTVRNPGGNVNSIPPLEGRNRQVNPAVSYSYRF